MITVEQLKKIVPFHNKKYSESIANALNVCMREFEINTRLRVCAFIAQLAHESGSFTYVKEIASGAAYEGRKDLGNTQPGDGVRYKGRGWIQITGRANYLQCGKALSLDLISKPELLEQIENAAKSAGWFWKSRGLNEIADKEDFKLITEKINGGYNGLPDRLQFYEKAKEVIK